MRSLLSVLVLAFAAVSCAAPPSSSSAEQIIVEFPVVAETRAEFIIELEKILVDTRAFDGCLGVTIWTNEEDASMVWLLEDWQTRAHQEAYLNWRMETGNTAHLGPYLAGDLRFLWLEQH
jgi:quinol monooxygenase YgiN